MPKKTMSELIAIGFQEGYAQAIQEFLQGHSEGFAAGFFQESDIELADVQKGRMFELAFAEGFISGNQAFRLNQTIDQYEKDRNASIDNDEAITDKEEVKSDEDNDDYPDIGDEKTPDDLWMDT